MKARHGGSQNPGRRGLTVVVLLTLLTILCGAASLAFALPPGDAATPELQLTALSQSSQWQDALETFSDMCRLDPSAALKAATWGAVMMACGRVAKWFEVMELLQAAVAKGVTPDSEMSASAANACANQLAWEEALLLLTLAPEASREILPQVVETCAVSGQSSVVRQLLREQLQTLDAQQGSALLRALSCTQQFWRESMALLAKMRGEQLEISERNLQDVMIACDPGSRWRCGGDDDFFEADRHPMEVLQLFCLAKQWSIEPSARLYQCALGGLYRASADGRFWAWALHLLEEMEATSFKATSTDFMVAIEAVSSAEPEEAPKMTAEERRAIKTLRAQLAKIRQPQGRRFEVPKFPPVLVRSKVVPPTEDAEPFESSPVLEEGILGAERMRTNEPVGGGFLRKWEMALSLFSKLESNGISSDAKSFDHVVAACARAQELAPCKMLLDNMHRNSVTVTSQTLESLIGGCSRKGLWQQALVLFRKAKNMQLAAAGTYNEALKACARGKQPRMAMWLLVEMDKGSMADGSSWVSSESITSAMAACATCSFWVQALQLLEKLKERQLQPSAKTYTAAVAACAPGGVEWEKTLYLLEESRQQNQTDGNVFAAAVIACQSRWELVLSVLVSMREARVAPIAKTYTDVLRLFTAAGKASAVVKFLEEPLQDYDLGEDGEDA